MKIVQVINKEVNLDKFSNSYLRYIRSQIRKKIENPDVLLINFIPKDSAKMKAYHLEILLQIQKEFTDYIIIPPNKQNGDIIKKWSLFWKPNFFLIPLYS